MARICIMCGKKLGVLNEGISINETMELCAKCHSGINMKYIVPMNKATNIDAVNDRFKEAISDAEYPEDIYLLWFDAAWDIIEKQNSSKLLFDMKTPEELLLLANKAILDSVPMTDEEEVEYDSAYGYDI